MKVIDPGHQYSLTTWGNKQPVIITTDGDTALTFLKRSTKNLWYGRDTYGGTNTQEVLRACIDRTKYLYSTLPSMETADALYHLRMALYLYEVRAYRRKREDLNRQAGGHDDTFSPNAHRDGYDDIPFSENNIELRPVGRDGHILLTPEENARALKWEAAPKPNGPPNQRMGP